MALTDALDAATARLKVFAETLRSVSAMPLRIENATTGATASTDRQEADDIKRGLWLQRLAALRKVL